MVGGLTPLMHRNSLSAEATTDDARANAAVSPFIALPEEHQRPLLHTLRALAGKRIVALFNRGNRGDGVIHLGGRTLLGALGLRWVEFHETVAPSEIDGDVLLVFGGGAFCHGTHTLPPLVERYAKQVEQVVILPASFDLDSAAVVKFVRSWSARYTVFCRERRSFEAVRAAHSAAGGIHLAHDLAFWADLRRWADRPHQGTVGIFRRDREAVFDSRPLDLPGRDISQGPDSEAEGLLDYVSRFSVIHTDRTHAAITAAMMGREVRLYRNAYFKNAAIFEHSLAQLQNVTFTGRQSFSMRQCAAVLFQHHVRRNAYRLKREWHRVREAGAERPVARGAVAAIAAAPPGPEASGSETLGPSVDQTAALSPHCTAATPRPALSIIMPAYNAGRFLVPAIESVLSQSFRDFEFIIIDDASTDGTREKIEEYAAKDRRIRSCPNADNLGVTRTLNRALSLARAEWIARMDADDLSLPGRFEKQMKLARSRPGIGLVTCPFDVIDARDRRVAGWRGICFQQDVLPFFLLFYNRLSAHGQVLYSARTVRELGGYREGYHLSEATELWIRMARHARWAIVPEPLYAWRAANPNSVTKQNTFRYAEGSLRACQEEIARACHLDLTREQMIALRDFWLRHETENSDWAEVERLIDSVRRRYQPPHPTAGWSRKVVVAVACGWLGHMVLQLKHRRFGRAFSRFRRAARVSGAYFPLALIQFVREAVAVRGQLSRRV